jgi:hypothetical protein
MVWWQVQQAEQTQMRFVAEKAQKIADTAQRIQLVGSTEYPNVMGEYAITTESYGEHPVYRKCDGKGAIWRNESTTNWMCHNNLDKLGGTSALLYWVSAAGEYSPEIFTQDVKQWSNSSWDASPSITIVRKK